MLREAVIACTRSGANPDLHSWATAINPVISDLADVGISALSIYPSIARTLFDRGPVPCTARRARAQPRTATSFRTCRGKTAPTPSNARDYPASGRIRGGGISTDGLASSAREIPPTRIDLARSSNRTSSAPAAISAEGGQTIPGSQSAGSRAPCSSRLTAETWASPPATGALAYAAGSSTRISTTIAASPARCANLRLHARKQRNAMRGSRVIAKPGIYLPRLGSCCKLLPGSAVRRAKVTPRPAIIKTPGRNGRISGPLVAAGSSPTTVAIKPPAPWDAGTPSPPIRRAGTGP